MEIQSVFVGVFWITTVLQGMQGITEATSSITWTAEPSIANSVTSKGQITHFDSINSLGQCVVECFADSQCVTVGFSTSAKLCQLYNIGLDGTQPMTETTEMHYVKSVCDNQAYTYIRRLNKCIKRGSTERSFDDARAECQEDGGDLLILKDDDVYAYLNDIMVFGTASEQYWLGATEDPGNITLWYWLDGTRMTDETGWKYWYKNDPTENLSSVCLLARVFSTGGVVFRDRECTANTLRHFLCEITP